VTSVSSVRSFTLPRFGNEVNQIGHDHDNMVCMVTSLVMVVYGDMGNCQAPSWPGFTVSFQLLVSLPSIVGTVTSGRDCPRRETPKFSANPLLFRN